MNHRLIMTTFGTSLKIFNTHQSTGECQMRIWHSNHQTLLAWALILKAVKPCVEIVWLQQTSIAALSFLGITTLTPHHKEPASTVNSFWLLQNTFNAGSNCFDQSFCVYCNTLDNVWSPSVHCCNCWRVWITYGLPLYTVVTVDMSLVRNRFASDWLTLQLTSHLTQVLEEVTSHHQYNV